MKVQELINLLNDLPKNLDVIIYDPANNGEIDQVFVEEDRVILEGRI